MIGVNDVPPLVTYVLVLSKFVATNKTSPTSTSSIISTVKATYNASAKLISGVTSKKLFKRSAVSLSRALS